MGIKFGQGLGWIKTLTGKDGNSYGTVGSGLLPIIILRIQSNHGVQYSSRRTGVLY